MFIFFANSLAITIYVSADTTMLGWIAGDYYTGLYAVSVKIYQIVKRLMTAVYTVTIPRLSRYAGTGQWQNYRKLLTQICSCVILLVIPCMTGLAIYAKSIIQILSGDSYLPAVRSLQILAVGIITLAIMRTLSASLQGIGKMALPVFNLFLGAVAKIIITYVLQYFKIVTCIVKERLPCYNRSI